MGGASQNWPRQDARDTQHRSKALSQSLHLAHWELRRAPYRVQLTPKQIANQWAAFLCRVIG